MCLSRSSFPLSSVFRGRTYFRTWWTLVCTTAELCACVCVCLSAGMRADKLLCLLREEQESWRIFAETGKNPAGINIVIKAEAEVVIVVHGTVSRSMGAQQQSDPPLSIGGVIDILELLQCLQSSHVLNQPERYFIVCAEPEALILDPNLFNYVLRRRPSGLACPIVVVIVRLWWMIANIISHFTERERGTWMAKNATNIWLWQAASTWCIWFNFRPIWLVIWYCQIKTFSERKKL